MKCNCVAYGWTYGSCINADPQAVGKQFEELAKTEEGLTAKSLLEASKPLDAPLHNEYEWNNTEAAEKWRLHQSRHFINSLTVTVTSKNHEPVQTRAVHITTVPHRYEPISVIVQEPTKYDRLLENAYKELESFQKKYEILTELKSVFDAIDNLKKR